MQYFLFRTFFEKYRQKYRGSFGFQVPSTGTAGTLNKVLSTGTAVTLKKYRCQEGTGTGSKRASFYVNYLKLIFVRLRLKNLSFPVFIGNNSS